MDIKALLGLVDKIMGVLKAIFTALGIDNVLDMI